MKVGFTGTRHGMTKHPTEHMNSEPKKQTFTASEIRRNLLHELRLIEATTMGLEDTHPLAMNAIRRHTANVAAALKDLLAAVAKESATNPPA
jgi:hypothetical protein